MPSSVSRGTCDWTRRTESFHLEQMKDTRNRATDLEEWGEQEKKWWDDQALGLSWAYSASRCDALRRHRERYESDDLGSSRGASHAVDLEAGRLELTGEPVPLARKNGIFTLYRDAGFSQTASSLENEEHESSSTWGLPTLLYPRPQLANVTETANITPTPNASKDVGHPVLDERPNRPTKRPLFAWLPTILTQSESRPSSTQNEKEKEVSFTYEYTSSKDNLSGTGDSEDTLSRQVKKRFRKRAGREKRRIPGSYTTKHMAEVLQRQEFILKFARAHLMFSGPSHRLQSHLQATARALDLKVSTVYLPNVILISFDDEFASTSVVRIIQQTGTLNLEKLSVMHELFWKVIHNELSVSSATATLELLMHSPSRYDNWETILTGGLSSSAICTIAFSGSFADSLAVFPLGCLLVMVQLMSAKHELYSNVFEITVATLLSFLSALLASSGFFCYAALASSSVVLILPGFFVLSGSLELASKHVVSGAVRICFAVIYALFLGFGISIGAQVFTRITHRPVIGPDDFLCSAAHQPTDPWWQRKPSPFWSFLTVPLFSLALSLHNHAPAFKKETLITVLISCAGWTANHFAGVAFHGRPDLQSAMGAFAVGVVANIYARITSGNAYVVMITGILFQLPSGLANGGLLTFAEKDNDAKNGDFTSFEAGFQVALQLIAVAIGLTVGLFTSVVVVHPFGGAGRKGALNAMFSL